MSRGIFLTVVKSFGKLLYQKLLQIMQPWNLHNILLPFCPMKWPLLWCKMCRSPLASGRFAPRPPPGRCPWTPPGVLKRAPGPHAVRGESFARYASHLQEILGLPTGISAFVHIMKNMVFTSSCRMIKI